MRRHKNLLFILPVIFLLLSGSISAQKRIRFALNFGDKEISSGSKVNDSISISTFRFYVSNILFLLNGNTVYSDPDCCHLVDLADTLSQVIVINQPAGLSFNQVQFGLGIDSITTEKASYTGALDPVNGMYWAWNSGFINLKLEGIKQGSEFEYHLGGYRFTFNCYQKVGLSIKDSPEIPVKVDLAEFFENIPASCPDKLMSPSALSLQLLGNAVSMFSILR